MSLLLNLNIFQPCSVLLVEFDHVFISWVFKNRRKDIRSSGQIAIGKFDIKDMNLLFYMWIIS